MTISNFLCYVMSSVEHVPPKRERDLVPGSSSILTQVSVASSSGTALTGSRHVSKFGTGSYINVTFAYFNEILHLIIRILDKAIKGKC